MMAAKEKGYGKLAVAGGVAANSRIRKALQEACDASGDKLYPPPLSLCGDNGEISMSSKNVKYNFLNIPDKFPTTASQTVNKKISQSQRDEKIPLILLHLKMTWTTIC